MYKSNAFKLQLILGLASISLLRADSPLLELSPIRLEADLTMKPMPKWQGGAFISIDQHSGSAVVLSVFDNTGRRLQDHLFHVVGSKSLSVRDFARAADGMLGLCGGVVDSDGTPFGYIAFMDPTKGSTHLVRTGPFVPMKVVFSADGTLWTQGMEYLPKPPGSKPRQTMAEALRPDAFAFLQFDRTGKRVRSAVPQSEIVDAIDLAGPAQAFAEVGKEIIWYAGQSRQLIAISRDGSYSQIRDLALPDGGRESAFGITEKGEILLSSQGKTAWSVLRLAPSRREWQPLAQWALGDRNNRPIWIIGSDGNEIAALGQGDGGIRKFRLTD